MKSNKTTALLMLLVFLLVVSVVIIFLTGLDRPTSTSNPYQNVTTTAVPTVAVETPEPATTPEATPTPSVAPTNAPVYYPPSTSMPSETASPIRTSTPPPAGVSVPSGTGATSATSGNTGTATATSTPIPGADANMLPAQDLIPIVPGANTAASGNADASGSSASVIPTGTSLGNGTFRSDSGTSINIHADWSAVVSGANTVDVTVTAYVDSYSLYTTASPDVLNIAVDGQYFSLASPAIEIPTTTTPVSTKINSRTVTVTLSGGETRNIPVEVLWHYRGTYGGTYLDSIECGGNITLSR